VRKSETASLGIPAGFAIVNPKSDQTILTMIQIRHNQLYRFIRIKNICTMQRDTFM